MARINHYRCECIQAGAGRDYRQREGLSQTHQDLGAVWSVHEDPQRYEEVSLTDGDCKCDDLCFLSGIDNQKKMMILKR